MQNSTGSWTVVVVVVAVAVPELMALDLCHLTLWMNSDPVSCLQVGRNLRDVVGVASQHSLGTTVLTDEILNFACESELFLQSLCQPLLRRHVKFPDRYVVLRH